MRKSLHQPNGFCALSVSIISHLRDLILNMYHDGQSELPWTNCAIKTLKNRYSFAFPEADFH